MVQLSHPYMTTGKTIALTSRTFGGKVISLLFNVLSRLAIAFLPKSKRLLVSWFVLLCLLISHSMVTWSSIHAISYIRISSFVKAESYSTLSAPGDAYRPMCSWVLVLAHAAWPGVAGALPALCTAGARLMTWLLLDISGLPGLRKETSGRFYTAAKCSVFRGHVPRPPTPCWPTLVTQSRWPQEVALWPSVHWPEQSWY